VHKRCKISVIRPGKKFIDAAAKKLYCKLENCSKDVDLIKKRPDQI
jgi:hypothetical protein